jgi:hypothetical protein
MAIRVQLIRNPRIVRTIDKTQNNATVTLGYQKKTCVLVRNGKAKATKILISFNKKIVSKEFDNTSVTQMSHICV